MREGYYNIAQLEALLGPHLANDLYDRPRTMDDMVTCQDADGKLYDVYYEANKLPVYVERCFDVV